MLIDGRLVDAGGGKSVNDKIDNLSKAPSEYTWTATEGQLTYTLPSGQSYDPNSKWFKVSVGGASVQPDLIEKTNSTSFKLLVPATSVNAGLKVVARWVEPFIPAAAGHKSIHEVGGQDEIDLTKLKGYDVVEDRFTQNDHKVGVSCSEIGLIPNVINEGINNYSKLTTAINKGYDIIVDDIYYLDTTVTSTIASSVRIYSHINGNGFKINSVNSGYLWNLDSINTLEIKGITFENETSASRHLFSFSDLAHVSQINVEGNLFSGELSLFRYYGKPNVDPDVTTYGINYVNFKNNIVKNTNSSFIVMSDTPHELVTLEGNEIKNFSFTFFASGINNDGLYKDKLGLKMKRLIAKNNNVSCEMSWWSKVTNGNYHCFILYEGDRIEYTGNKVEGLKSDGSLSVYDVYLSCFDVVYENNKWINNLSMSSTNLGNVLLKSKSGRPPFKRRYRNNHFIATKEFVTSLGKSLDNASLDLMQITGTADEFIVEDNVFDIYYLKLFRGSVDCYSFLMNRNIFNVERFGGGSFLFPQINSGIDYSKKIHSFKGNIINSNGTGSVLNDLPVIMSARDYSSKANKLSEIIIEDNHGNTPFSYCLYDTSAAKAVIRNNHVETKNANGVNAGIGYNNTIDRLINTNNEFMSKDTYYYEDRSLVGGNYIIEDYTIIRNGGDHGNSALYLNKNNANAVKRKYIREYELQTSTGVRKFSYEFEYGYNSTLGKNYITFTDSTDVVRTFNLNNGGTDTEGSGTNIKLNFTSALTDVTVSFVNNSTVSYFKHAGFPNYSESIVKIKTNSFVV